jgi:hypothetical protein
MPYIRVNTETLQGLKKAEQRKRRLYILKKGKGTEMKQHKHCARCYRTYNEKIAAGYYYFGMLGDKVYLCTTHAAEYTAMIPDSITGLNNQVFKLPGWIESDHWKFWAA